MLEKFYCTFIKTKNFKMRPDSSSYPEFFEGYISLVREDNILSAITIQSPDAITFFQSITEEQSEIKYAADKWTIKEVLQHLIDAERIFTYRALAIARRDKQTLPGFDENTYADYSHANDQSWLSLVQEFKAVRNATIELAKSFNNEDLQQSGSVSTYTISVLALLYMTIGHAVHHVKIIKERYLNN